MPGYSTKMSGKIEPRDVDITDEEAALYDRQIRLWGIDAQKRLRKSQVLVSGLGGLGAEVAKNIILAGVKSITLIDDKEANAENCSNQFLIPRDSYGTNRAVASVDRAAILNPMVVVQADSEPLKNKTSKFFKSFDLVILTDSPAIEINQVNNICKDLGVKFLSSSCWGLTGYLFLDLQEHEYLFEMQTKPDNFEPSAKKPKSDVDENSKYTKRVAEFIPFSETFKIDWTTERFTKRVKRISPMFFVMQVILKFLEKYRRQPTSSKEDNENLLKLKADLISELKIPEDKIPDDILSVVHGECNPVCAIVGGIAAQEIIKALSHQDEPVNNYFFFEALTNHGIVEYLGY